MKVPKAVKEWVRQEIVAITGTAYTRCDGNLCQLARELLVEASQRPEFAAHAEACQAAATKPIHVMRSWVHAVLRPTTSRNRRLCVNITLRPRVMLRIKPSTDGADLLFSYCVAFNGAVDSRGLVLGGRPRALPGAGGAPFGQNRVKLKIHRTFPTAAEAFDYEQRVRETVDDPAYKTPKEKVAAAHCVPLRRTERSQ